ncbi:hypothetical protein QCA50_009472 [Cerrena zonata]|uniref:Uncharacterized protein n=1 Tax=Cerrena zonata TaxID=2478898 RepID=A0AAW0G2L1_9APHY
MSSSSPLNPPTVPSTNKFLTPSHTPSAINQVIQNNNNNNNLHKTNFNDLTDFMNQLNSFGGPLTDIDPLPQDSNQQQGITPPMMATKSNTRVINIYEDYEGEDKENWPPVGEEDNEDQNDFDKMIAKSFTLNNTPDHNEWSTLFGGPTPKDQTTPKNNQDDKNQLQQNAQQKITNSSNLPQLRTFKSSPLKLDKAASVANMPSSPLLSSNIENIEDEVNNLVSNEMFNDSSSPATHASRLDTVMSYNHNLGKQSSPLSDFYSNDEKLNH